jgi:hypothetical protein
MDSYFTRDGYIDPVERVHAHQRPRSAPQPLPQLQKVESPLADVRPFVEEIIRAERCRVHPVLGAAGAVLGYQLARAALRNRHQKR